jgi:hypothetical protein
LSKIQDEAGTKNRGELFEGKTEYAGSGVTGYGG